MPQDETGRRPDLSDLDSFAGVDELDAEGYEDSDDHDPELDARDTAFDVGGGSRGGIGGVGQLGDNLATGPVPDLTVPEDTELHELD
ncbi:dihydrofolate synthase, partial [Amycolatopsis sp. NPDC051114]